MLHALRLAGPVLLALAALTLWLLWDRVPERWITHWGPDGVPDGWAERSAADAALPLVIGLAIWCGLELLAVALARRPGPPALVRANGVATRIVGTSVASLFAVLSLALPLLHPAGPLGIGILAVATTFGATALAFLYMVRTVRRLEASGVLPRSGARGGLFYVDRSDRRIFVPKTIGIGWTLNFGNPRSWLVLALLLLPTLAMLMVHLIAAR